MYTLKSVSTSGLFLALLMSSSSFTGSENTAAKSLLKKELSTGRPVAVPAETTKINLTILEEAGVIYDSMHLAKQGLNKQAFAYAWKGYYQLQKTNRLYRKNILSICDFSQSSRKKRLYIIDVANKKLLLNTYVAHGKNSGAEYARTFSNNPESHQSSLGFYRTRNTYFGEHGLSLKIEGLEKGFNDKADARNIVVHGSDYVGAAFLKNNAFNGRSFGCPAIPSKLSPKVINTIKSGTCLFIYHPTKKYLTQSKILNG